MRNIIHLYIKGGRVCKRAQTLQLHTWMTNTTLMNKGYRIFMHQGWEGAREHTHDSHRHGGRDNQTPTSFHTCECVLLYTHISRVHGGANTPATHVNETCHTHGLGMLYIYAYTIEIERVQESAKTIVIDMNDVTHKHQCRFTLVSESHRIPIYQGSQGARESKDYSHTHEYCNTQTSVSFHTREWVISCIKDDL